MSMPDHSGPSSGPQEHSTPSSPRRAPSHQLWLGLALVFAGCAFLLDSLHLFELRRYLPFWPVLIIALGAARLLTAAPNDKGEQVVGGVLLAIGCFLLFRRLGWLHMDFRDLWPLFLIGVGGMLLTRRPGPAGVPGKAGLFGRGQHDHQAGPLDVKAVLSGQQVRVQAQDFTGGQMQVALGGVELDLSQAGFQRAVIDVSLVMAGLELRVPTDCRVRVTASSVLGQVEDKTQPPLAAARELEVRGSLVLGGITIRH